MDYCQTALKLRKIKVVCGKNCPIYLGCPVLILEDANDKVSEINDIATKQAIEAMIEAVTGHRKEG